LSLDVKKNVPVREFGGVRSVFGKVLRKLKEYVALK